MNIHWVPSDPPLPAVAVAASGAAAKDLEAKAGRDPAWTVTRVDGWIVVAGDQLPWADGAIYLGRLPGTAQVLVPVHRRPWLHPELVERATSAVLGTQRWAALIPGTDGVTVVPLAP